MSGTVSMLAVGELLAFLATTPGGAPHLSTLKAVLSKVERQRAGGRKRSEEHRKKRAGDACFVHHGDVTTTTPNPPQTPPLYRDSGDHLVSSSLSGERVSDLSAHANTQRHVTWAQLADAYDTWWQENFPRVVNPRTAKSQPGFEDGARMVNQQAAIESVHPHAMKVRVMDAFRLCPGAIKCGHKPGAIAGCFAELIGHRSNGKPVVASRVGVKGDPVPEAGNG